MIIPYRTLGAVALLGLSSSGAFSQTSLYEEQGKLIRAPRALGVLGEGLFGDETNFYTGSLSFFQTDVNLPGNNNLQMAITRRFTAGDFISTVGHFGHWELEVPRIHGIFSAATGTGTTRGWIVNATASTNATDRCSSFGAPPDSRGARDSLAEFAPEEFWHGTQLTIPGQGTQEVLWRNGYDVETHSERFGGNKNFPADGNVYPLVTKNMWAIRCLSTLASGQAGEGFLAVSPDGTQYKFDWMIDRPIKSLTKGSTAPQPGVQAGLGGSAIVVPGSEADDDLKIPEDEDPDPPPPAPINSLPRREYWMVPTLVTDKFGNSIRYTWEGWKLLEMAASDGRRLTFTYAPNTYQIATVSDGTRTWTYNYQADNIRILSEVVNPDNSRWQLAGIDALAKSVNYGVSTPGCQDSGGVVSADISGSMTHPSGAVGTFVMRPVLHGRTGVIEDCRTIGLGTDNITQIAINPRYFYTQSLAKKTIAGPGLPAMSWSMAYGEPNAGWSTCTNCKETKEVIATDPKGDRVRYTFGNKYNATEGLLLKTDYGWNGSTALRTVEQKYCASTAGPYVDMVGFSEQNRGDAEMSGRLMPVEQRITTQQGVTFTWQANEFDTKARATSVTRASSLGMSRTETTSYQDISTKWVLGLVKNVTEASTNLVMQANSYDTSNGNLLTTRHFGHLDETRTYYADGTLATKADGKNQTTSFSNYKLGLAQNVSYADNSSESAVVNNIGLITSTTDAAGFTTYYDYDAAGRLNLIRYPAGDAVAWNDTTITTEQVFGNEYDLAAGHWKQTVATGDARSVSYLDAFWRPVLSRTYDQGVGAESLTSKMIVRQFDHKGKTTFESYPQRFISSINSLPGGVSTQYDALSRPTQTLADSELGKLKTSIEYLSGFQKRVTNARNRASTSSYQVYDEPSENALTAMQMPEGVSLSITRDVFGKPLAISRRGSFDGNVNINTRNYVYDAYQRLCKTIEPEVGVMKQQMDDANNVLWRANGTTGNSLTECFLDYVQAAEKVSYSYDAQNRLRSTSFGDNSPAITRTWTPDGLPETISSAGTTWTTYYNRRRLPMSETLTLDSKSYALGWSYNVNGHLDSLTYPNGLAISYTPNALGEPTRVDKFATGISYHPNGAIAGFTYGNGIVRSLSLNARNLPYQAKDAGVLLDTYGFDENGNVTGISDQQESISDQQESISDRSMSYDGLDRLVSANAPKLWGLGSFRYDALDNLRTSAVGSRNSTHNYDLTGTNRLDNINTNGVVTSYQYDNLGNIVQRGNQGFSFDRGNRLKSASGKGTYLYDGLGHRSKITGADGSIRIQVYSPAGQLLYGTSTLPGKTPASTNYIYLHHGMIAEVNQ